LGDVAVDLRVADLSGANLGGANLKEAWALKLRDNRNIGDFRAWKDHEAYQRTLERLLRDLRVESSQRA
jgi:hypothetical protein